MTEVKQLLMEPALHILQTKIRGHNLARMPSGGQRVILRRLSQNPTARIERFLLIATITLLPLENHIPTVAGFSVMYIMFGILASYILFNRLTALTSICLHPVFLAAYVLLALGCLIEFLHPHSSYSEIFQIGLMLAGAISVASLCRDRPALRAGIYGYLIAAVGMSVLLFLTSYSALSGTTTADFYAASLVRSDTFKDMPLHSNLNAMARIAAQGVVVALALALAAKSAHQRNLFLGLFLFCLVATFLPMSRSGVAIVAISCVTVMFAYGVNIKTTIIAAAVGATILIWVPDAVFSRLTYSTQAREGKMEGRARVYSAAVEHLPEYVMTGVGVGNFWGPWGTRSRFGEDHVIGSHNGFIQVTIYWGLAGFLALTALVWRAYRCLPKRCGADGLSLCLLGIAVSVFLMLFAAHDLYAKGYSLGLGMLVGARHWIWPQGIVRSATQIRKASPPIYDHLGQRTLEQ